MDTSVPLKPCEDAQQAHEACNTNFSTFLPKENVNQLWEGYEGHPVVSLLIRPTGYDEWPLKVTKPLEGTASTLEMTDVQLTIMDSVRPYTKNKTVYKTNVHLRDTLSSSEFPFQFPSQNGVVVNGVIQCIIPFKPKYRQTGEILDIDDKSSYLFIKLINIDRLYSQLSNQTTDSFIEVNYNGVTKHSSIVYQSIHPYYQSEMIFKLDLDNLHTKSVEELQDVGSLMIDVWGNTTNGCQHHGWTELYLSEMHSRALTQPQTKNYYDRRKAKDVSYNTSVFSFVKELVQLNKLDNDTKKSFLSMEVWTKLDIVENHVLNTKWLPVPTRNIASDDLELFADLKEQLQPLVDDWQRSLNDVHQSSPGLRCLAIDQRKRLLPFNFFLYPVTLPAQLGRGPFSCLNFVRTIWYKEDDSCYNRYPTWCSPEFILKRRQGEPTHHALLLASLFLGIQLNAYVCIGTRIREEDEYAWVLTLHKNTDKSNAQPLCRLWDPLTMTVFDFPPGTNVAYPSPTDSDTLDDAEDAKGSRPLLKRFSVYSDFQKLTGFDKRKGTGATLKKGQTSTHTPDGRESDRATLTLKEMHLTYGVLNQASQKNPLGQTRLARRIVPITEKTIPFKNLLVVFNQHNVYGWLGDTSVPVDLEFTNSTLWLPLYPQGISFKLHALFPKTTTVSASGFRPNHHKNVFCDDIVKGIQALRFRMSITASSVWALQRPIQNFLEEGMRLVAELDNDEPDSPEIQEHLALFEEWKLALLSLTPDNHKLRWCYVTFNHMNVKYILDHLWNTIPFFKESDTTLQFSVGVHIKVLPSDALLTYIVVVALTKLTRMQRRQLTLVDKLYKD